VVCPTCGFPIRLDALPRGGGRPGGGSSSATLIIVVALVAGGVFAVVVIGILAAIAIPRFTQASERAKEKQGETLLKWGYAAEQAYFDQRGMYTTHVDSLEPMLAPPADVGPKRYTLEVSAASDRDLCLEAVPVAAAADAHALSMDVGGRLYRSAGCSGEPDISVPAGTGGDDGARRMMREVHESIAAYRAEHGGENPRTLSDVLTRVHDSPAMGEYRLELVRGDADGVCAAVLPRNPLAGLHAYSVDHDGNLYESPACAGSAVEHFATAAADEKPASGTADPPSATDGEPVKRDDKPIPVERAP
jgi:type IV pilus assembly protein PilE